MHPVIENYERLSSLTSKMREAAAQGKWDHLVDLVEQRKAHVAAIKVQDAALEIDEGTRSRKEALIRKIMDDDKVIRDQTNLWMKQLQRTIQSVRKEKLLLKAYFDQEFK
jgi:flagellar protein FliT